MKVNAHKLFLVNAAIGLLLTGITTNVEARDRAANGSSASVLAQLDTIDTVASTVPSNGDLNPYGVARVTQTSGNLQAGHFLVSNFNDSSNVSGKGSTIVDVAPDGTTTTFATLNANSLPDVCPGGVGLTNALAVLRSGWVIVGSLPTTDGTPATASAGCLIVLDNTGTPVQTIHGSLINGPWGMTVFEQDNRAALFVTNVLNDTVAADGDTVNKGTVVRINLDLSGDKPAVHSMTVVGSGFAQKTDPEAIVLGPTGLGLSTLVSALKTDQSCPQTKCLKKEKSSRNKKRCQQLASFCGCSSRGTRHSKKCDAGSSSSFGSSSSCPFDESGSSSSACNGSSHSSCPSSSSSSSSSSSFSSSSSSSSAGSEVCQGNEVNVSLYVADTVNNRIVVITDALNRLTSAGTGTILSSGGSLNEPLGQTVTSGGHILVVNGGDGFITEITPSGTQVASKLLDNTGSPAGEDTLFGLALDAIGRVYFVNDRTDTLNVLE